MSPLFVLLLVFACKDKDDPGDSGPADGGGSDGGGFDGGGSDGGGSDGGGSDGGGSDGGVEDLGPWLLPLPAEMITTGDPLILTETTRICVAMGGEPSAEYLAQALRPATGYPFPVVATACKAGDISFWYDVELPHDPESYRLEVGSGGAAFTAGDEAGLFYAAQTFLQLLPTQIFSPTLVEGVQWQLDGVQIEDAPRFPWRGAMIDVARHFFDVEAIQRQIDLMALHKLNRLHLHLTDDQGWRIEIRSWPELAIIGGASEVGGGEGGYFSQEEYSALVAYAAQRHITVIPEIDFPGHSNAALSAYGVLNPSGEPIEVYTGAGVISTGLWLDGESTWPMVQDVWTEIAALTPSPTVHMGGDEAIDIASADYLAFIQDLHGFIASQGKTAIGWDEIATAEPDPPFIAQYWLDEDNARAAVANGGQMLASPAWTTYLDMAYDTDAEFGQVWAGLIDIQTAYDWEPVLPGLEEGDVIGVEGPLWTEYIDTEDKMDFMLWPRLCAHAELGWTPASHHDWPQFSARLRAHGQRLDLMGVNFYASPEMDW